METKVNEVQEEKAVSEHAFLLGWSQIKKGDLPKVKRQIMTALKIGSETSWNRRLYGKVVPRVDEAKLIEVVFASHGVKKVWGVPVE